MVERLPAGFQTDPALATAVDSSLDSISAGIQAAQASGPLEIGDLLQNYAACFPPIGTTLEPLTSFTDAAAIQSPEFYLNNARQLGGEDSLAGFSDLISMNRVAEKLSDPKFDHQKSLQSFSDVLAEVQLSGDPSAPVPLEEARLRRRVDVHESSADKELGSESMAAYEFLPADSAQRLPDGDSHAVIAIIKQDSDQSGMSNAEFSQRLESLKEFFSKS